MQQILAMQANIQRQALLAQWVRLLFCIRRWYLHGKQ
jgi:hypothetical protein